MIRRDFQIQRRASATGPVLLRPSGRNDTVEHADELTRLALAMLAEDERRRLEDQPIDGVPFGPWLSEPGAARITDTIARLVEVVADMRLRQDITPHAFRTASALASYAGIERTRVLADIAPRAQLLPALVAAGFAVDGMLGPVAAFLLYADAGVAGRDAHVFGVHNVPGSAALSRVVGVAALGPDTCVPVTAHALITGLVDDPSTAGADLARIDSGREAMARWAFDLPRSFAEHVSQALAIVAAARDIVHTAAFEESSRACRDARVRAADMLTVGFSRWALLGSTQVGPRIGAGHATAGRRVAPGLDAAVLRAAADQRFRPLAHAAHANASGPSIDPREGDIVYACDGASASGVRLVEALLRGDRTIIPSLRELSGAQLHAAENQARNDGIPCTIDARYLVATRGLALTGNGKPLPVSVLLRVGPLSTTMWTTTLDLADSEALSGAVTRAEIHVRSIESPMLNRGVAQFFDDHDTHRFQASSYQKHTAMRIVTLLANLAAVGVARAHQAGRGPTR